MVPVSLTVIPRASQAAKKTDGEKLKVIKSEVETAISESLSNLYNEVEKIRADAETVLMRLRWHGSHADLKDVSFNVGNAEHLRLDLARLQEMMRLVSYVTGTEIKKEFPVPVTEPTKEVIDK